MFDWRFFQLLMYESNIRIEYLTNPYIIIYMLYMYWIKKK